MAQLTPESLRAARAILDWSRRDLVAASGVGRATIEALEATDPTRKVRPETAEKIVATFTAHGVEVLGEPTPGARRIPRE